MIFVSPEQGSHDLVTKLQARGLTVLETKLDYADVEFAGRGPGGVAVQIGIECKRLTELTSDYDRLAGFQIPRMLGEYDHRWVVYEGEWHRNREGLLYGRRRGGTRPLHGQANAIALRKKIITLEMLGGVHTQETRDRRETVDFIEALYRWWTDEDLDKHTSHIVSYEPHGLVPMTKFQRAFAAWPDLSVVRSKAVARRFKNSIHAAVTADEDTWANIEVPDKEGKVRRLGHKVAERMVQFLRGRE